MKIKVISRAKTDAVFERDIVTVKTTASPKKGEANKKLEEFLTEFFGARTVITKGFKNKEKEIIVQGLSDEQALQKIRRM